MVLLRSSITRQFCTTTEPSGILRMGGVGSCDVMFEVYHLRSLAKSWSASPDSEVGVNGSSLTWLLREVFTGDLT